ncbi:hypothetical protein [Mangrovicoccus algicola]|uniref:Uncharacterized protein n=1 Tax=Mangrovicoccus algicola TaxID=2771008 RepID=A0A8J7CHB7_9RHOB|nr:hypothetical protein [Mangrovicoccus algicola]MBE3638025.1 hypothetical protein [Mangrovicoccus algicola]
MPLVILTSSAQPNIAVYTAPQAADLLLLLGRLRGGGGFGTVAEAAAWLRTRPVPAGWYEDAVAARRALERQGPRDERVRRALVRLDRLRTGRRLPCSDR